MINEEILRLFRTVLKYQIYAIDKSRTNSEKNEMKLTHYPASISGGNLVDARCPFDILKILGYNMQNKSTLEDWKLKT